MTKYNLKILKMLQDTEAIQAQLRKAIIQIQSQKIS